eukprot:TRINITY_DN3784_c0_g1_i6.p1 TRINITY_DN3784_c0_g1~~TRINITY_DN3784_c0_g1_i6.p1  ORF type:complete len:517 (+),score=88.48 TRINITY_DN3784_c0_g1_i6:43-1593(+)
MDESYRSSETAHTIHDESHNPSHSYSHNPSHSHSHSHGFTQVHDITSALHQVEQRQDEIRRSLCELKTQFNSINLSSEAVLDSSATGSGDRVSKSSHSHQSVRITSVDESVEIAVGRQHFQLYANGDDQTQGVLRDSMPHSTRDSIPYSTRDSLRRSPFHTSASAEIGSSQIPRQPMFDEPQQSHTMQYSFAGPEEFSMFIGATSLEDSGHGSTSQEYAKSSSASIRNPLLMRDGRVEVSKSSRSPFTSSFLSTQSQPRVSSRDFKTQSLRSPSVNIHRAHDVLSISTLETPRENIEHSRMDSYRTIERKISPKAPIYHDLDESQERPDIYPSSLQMNIEDRGLPPSHAHMERRDEIPTETLLLPRHIPLQQPSSLLSSRTSNLTQEEETVQDSLASEAAESNMNQKEATAQESIIDQELRLLYLANIIQEERIRVIREITYAQIQSLLRSREGSNDESTVHFKHLIQDLEQVEQAHMALFTRELERTEQECEQDGPRFLQMLSRGTTHMQFHDEQ